MPCNERNYEPTSKFSLNAFILMMKKFILIVCGSFVGVWLALAFFTIASVVMSFAIFGSMASMGAQSVSIKNNSLLYIDLSGVINEREGSGDFDPMSLLQGGDFSEPASLDVLTKAIAAAQSDKKIKGIYIDCEGVAASPATLFELRAALSDFKKQSGKFIYAYGNEGISQADYYVASVADSIFLNPVGAVDIHGLAASIAYPKRLLDKLGIEMQVIRVGTFKSAVEPYMIDSISPANRLQQQHYLGSIWGSMTDSMATARHLTPARINQLADSIVITMPADSLKANKLIDGICYRRDFENKLKKLTKVDLDDDLNLVSPQDMCANAASAENTSAPKEIAVVYAVGEIDGQSGSGIDSEELVETIQELENDKDVKGLVLRVNSPGGSAFGSEQIWHALDDFKKSGKTFAVSMGDYAASGGYYISCGAQRIFAEPVTITGSIGIFGVIPNLKGVVNDKLNVNISTVKTNTNADFGVITKPLTAVQRAAMQGMINRGYDLFTRRCADGRHVSQDSIKKIAEGRVWDGISAKQIGLVDEFGNLDKAINWVAKKENLDKRDYKVNTYPSTKNKWLKMLDKYTSAKADEQLQQRFGIIYEGYRQAEAILSRKHVLCLMQPVDIE